MSIAFTFYNSTCRLGSHSTSDDQSLYQDMDQVGYWSEHLHPTSRLKLYMMNRGLWDERKEEDLLKRLDKEIKAISILLVNASWLP